MILPPSDQQQNQQQQQQPLPHPTSSVSSSSSSSSPSPSRTTSSNQSLNQLLTPVQSKHDLSQFMQPLSDEHNDKTDTNSKPKSKVKSKSRNKNKNKTNTHTKTNTKTSSSLSSSPLKESRHHVQGSPASSSSSSSFSEPSTSERSGNISSVIQLAGSSENETSPTGSSGVESPTNMKSDSSSHGQGKPENGINVGASAGAGGNASKSGNQSFSRDSELRSHHQSLKMVKGSRASSAKDLGIEVPPLQSLTSSFQMSEYLALLIAHDIHDVRTLVEIPSITSAKVEEQKRGGEARVRGEEGADQQVEDEDEDEDEDEEFSRVRAGSVGGGGTRRERGTSATELRGMRQKEADLWIYEHLRRLPMDLTPLLTSLLASCSRSTCPEMKAGEWMYLCVAPHPHIHSHGHPSSGGPVTGGHHPGHSAGQGSISSQAGVVAVGGKERECCAIDYILHTIDSHTALWNNSSAFPSRLAIQPGSNKFFGQQARRLSRIFGHAYHHHREVFEQCESETSLYARFLALAQQYDLISKELLSIPFKDPIPKTRKDNSVGTDSLPSSSTSYHLAPAVEDGDRKAPAPAHRNGNGNGNSDDHRRSLKEELTEDDEELDRDFRRNIPSSAIKPNSTLNQVKANGKAKRELFPVQVVAEAYDEDEEEALELGEGSTEEEARGEEAVQEKVGQDIRKGEDGNEEREKVSTGEVAVDKKATENKNETENNEKENKIDLPPKPIRTESMVHVDEQALSDNGNGNGGKESESEQDLEYVANHRV